MNNFKIAKILDIHKKSAWYDDRDELIGQIIYVEELGRVSIGGYMYIKGKINERTVHINGIKLCFNNKNCKTCKDRLRCITT